jgi:hypothetical protein
MWSTRTWLIPIVVAVAAAAMLVSLIAAAVVPETCDYLVGSVVPRDFFFPADFS